jgi:hypothetical protein
MGNPDDGECYSERSQTALGCSALSNPNLRFILHDYLMTRQTKETPISRLIIVDPIRLMFHAYMLKYAQISK